MARPRIKINWGDFDKLCNIHCTLVEISEWFDCSEDTIERAVKREKGMGFAEYYKRKSSRGKISLRRKMVETALSGNTTMMIFLSKQHLGYSDKVEEKSEVKNTQKQVVEIQWADENDHPTEDEEKNASSETNQ